MGSAYSSSLGVEFVIKHTASLRSTIQLHDFYCLIINYNYILIYNKHCNKYGLTCTVYIYTASSMHNICLCTACKIHHSMLNSCTEVQFSTHINIPVKFAELVCPTETKMPNSKHLHLVIQHGTACTLLNCFPN
jgi:hypothetical protein